MARIREIAHITPLPPLSPEGPGARPADNRPSAGRLPGLRAARTAPSPGFGRRRSAARAAARRFVRCGRASVALETAVALGALVISFAGLMDIVGDVYENDWTGRNARAVARTIALNPSADPWAALKREGGLSANATCAEWKPDANTCGGWTLKIDRGVAPADLPADLATDVSSFNGEVVLVRLDRGDAVMFGLARSEPQD